MSQKHPASPAPRRAPADFTPVRTRQRHDGWTAERQSAFIEALAECGCVEEACQRVGMAPSSAYALRRRLDASSFRQAWDHALDFAIRRLSDAAFSRALNGVARPVFYQGEQIGERRHYDERLTMFLLRYRDPVRYGTWLDDKEARRHPEGAALTLAKSLVRVDQDAFDAEMGRRPRPRPPLATVHHVTEAEREAAERAAEAAHAEAAERAERARLDRGLAAELQNCVDSGGDVA